jgi:hypothetical protein
MPLSLTAAAGDPVRLVHDQQVCGTASGGESVGDDRHGRVGDEHDPLPVPGLTAPQPGGDG